MRGHARMGGDDFVQQGAAGTSQATNKDRRGDSDRPKFAGEEAGFQPAQAKPEIGEMVNQAADQVQEWRHEKRRLLVPGARPWRPATNGHERNVVPGGQGNLTVRKIPNDQ